MFLLALTALSVLALLPLVAGGLAVVRCAHATGSQAAVRAAAQATWPDTGMPDSAQTNHPVSLREVRLANDASSPAASAAVSPDLAEGDDLETTNTPADTSLCRIAHTRAATHGLPPSASPHSMRGLGLGVSHDRAGQSCLPRKRRAHGLDQASCTASPRPRLRAGDAERKIGAACTTLALFC